MKDAILTILRQAGDYLSGQEISRTLGVSRTAVWKAVEKLRQEGYIIESAPNRGYRLSQATPQLRLSEILAHLPPDYPWRNSITFFESIDSTNSRAKAMAAANAPHGTVLIADEQTGGRGRRGRSFLSPPGTGVYLSVLLRPDCVPSQLMHLTCATAVAMCDAIEEVAHFRPGIKWTNDLVSHNKKLAGILTELSLEAESGQVQYAVVGIGINCCQEERDFPPELREMAASLSMIAGQTVDRNALAAAMVKALIQMDAVLLTNQSAIMERYRADCITIGREVSLRRGDTVRRGRALDVDDNGALVVQFSDGHTEAVNSGEVSIRGMYGYV